MPASSDQQISGNCQLRRSSHMDNLFERRFDLLEYVLQVRVSRVHARRHRIPSGDEFASSTRRQSVRIGWSCAVHPATWRRWCASR